MKRVLKYRVETAEVFSLQLPVGARFLSVQEQRGLAQMWFLVDDEAYGEERLFMLAGTGHPIHPDFENAGYLGTFQLSAGLAVFHLFEVCRHD